MESVDLKATITRQIFLTILKRERNKPLPPKSSEFVRDDANLRGRLEILVEMEIAIEREMKKNSVKPK